MPLTIQELQKEVNGIKAQIKELRRENNIIKTELLKIDINSQRGEQSSTAPIQGEEQLEDLNEQIRQEAIEQDQFLNYISRIHVLKWIVKIKLVINQEYVINTIVLLDIGADMNCVQEGLIPIQYFEKTTERFFRSNHSRLKRNYKISNVRICKQDICFKTTFILVKDLHPSIILETPFSSLIYPFSVDRTRIKTTIGGNEYALNLFTK